MQRHANDRGRRRVASLASTVSVQARIAMLLGGIASLCLTSCGPTRVRADFTHYENSYAVTSNQEVLLNLARLRQHDPTYFFKLGQISSSYRMQASLTGTGNYTPQGTVPGGAIPTGGGTPGFIYENDPAFSFVPVNDQANATLLLQPVSEDVFYSLYQQGWRVDQLFRLMVDRIEVTLPVDPAHLENGCRVEIIRNVPPPPYEDMNSPGAKRNLSRYVTFLRISAIVYELQKHGLLQLGGPTVFEPLNRKSGLEADKSLPLAKDVVDAAAKNQVWQMDVGKDGKEQWLLGTMNPRPAFELSSIRPGQEDTSRGTVGSQTENQEQEYGTNVQREEDFLTALFRDDPNLHQLAGDLGAPELTDILDILYSGFAIGGSPSDPNNGDDSTIGPCVTTTSASSASQHAAPDTASSNHSSSGAQSTAAASPSASSSLVRPAGRVACRLVMRSLIGLMAASAQEEKAFDRLMTENPVAQLELKVGGKNGKDARDGLVCAVHKALITKSDGTTLSSKTLLDKVCDVDTLTQSTPTFHFNELVPSIERLPVLRLTWDTQQAPTTSQQSGGAGNPDIQPNPAEDHESVNYMGLSVKYRNKYYWITDSDVSDAAEANYKDKSGGAEWPKENQYWNRDMFRLIDQLSAQVTVDISKFPLPEILQLRTE
jgi:hypothetical protein